LKKLGNHWVYLLPWVLGTVPLCALPELGEVAAGQAEVQQLDPRTLSITTSDRAILHFRKFNIADKEHVQFIQPSSKSSVLNRITGGDPSQILGKLSANGHIFLVNPNGIVFGPKAMVNTGSFVASTLNIRDEDFLNDKYQFVLESGSEHSSIINHGLISASPEGFVAMFAPFIENRGSILAKAGRVILASAERVTLDFAGDGLIQFTVDGELKNALIENFGKIEAAHGGVDLSMRTARQAIKMVVNTDGITPANALEEVNGIIHLVNTSQIAADRVRVEGADLAEVSGEIDVVRKGSGEVGGHVEILGDNIHLVGATIDASGDAGGGKVRVGGEYQGKGETPTAQNTVMDADSIISADAYREGKGGEVILWADETTLFDGKIYARGGLLGGDGGFVETSGKIDLGVETGHVNTSAPMGHFGEWLLDPASITIASGGTNGAIANGSAPNCATAGTLNIRTATLQAAATNVALCAQNAAGSTITVNNAFTMAAGISISLTAGSGSAGTITLNAGITTRGQPISLTGLVVLGANITLDATNAGASPTGGNISFSNTINGSGARTLTLRGGTSGVVTMTGAVGAGTALTSLTATGATITQTSTARTTGALSYTGTSAINLGGAIRTTGGVVTMTGPVVVSGSPTIDTTNAGGTAAGANINFSGATSTINGATALTLRAGTGGVVSFGSTVGNSTPLTNLSFTSASSIQIGNNITVTGANPLTFPSPVSLTGASTITTNNANLTFSNTINGGQTLALAAGSGTITLSNNAGAATSLTSLTLTTTNATASAITLSGTTYTTTGAQSYTAGAGGLINVTGAVGFNTTNNNITFATGTLTPAAASVVTLTAGSGAISVGPVNGASTTTLHYVNTGTATTTGVVTIGTLDFTAPSSISIANNITSLTGALTFPASVTLTGNSTITTTNQSISFSNNVTQASTQTLTVNGGSGGAVSITGNLGVNAFTVTNSAGTTITGTTTSPTVTLTNTTGNITFNGAATVATAFTTAAQAYGVIFNNGGTITPATTFSNTGGVTLKSGGSASLTFTNGFTRTAGATTILGTIKATASTAGMTLGVVTFSAGSSSLVTNAGVVSAAGAVTLTGDASIDTTNAGGTPAGAGITFSSTINGAGNLTLNAGTGGTITFTGAVGGGTRIGALTITNANNVTANAITAASITESAGQGTTTFNGVLDTNGVAGISLNGNIFNVNANVTTTNNGAFTITHTGLFTVPSGVTFNVSGGYTDNGPGPTSFGGNIVTNGHDIVFSAALVLPNSISLSTGTGVGNISFLSTVNGTVAGAQNLTLAVDGGNITFSGAVGGTTRLGILTISSANNVTAAALNCTTISQVLGTGTSTFNGAIDLNNASGLSLTTVHNVTINSTVNTTSGGPVAVQLDGTLVLGSGAAFTIDGPFTQSGTGAVQSAGSITTTNDTIQFAGAVNLTGTNTYNTGAGIGNILFSSTLDGPGALNLSAGTGTITFTGAVGSATRLGALTATSGSTLTAMSSVRTASINQSGITGLSTYSGDINTNAVAGVQLVGTSFTINGNLISTNAGPFTITNSGALTLTAGASTSLSAAFTQSGGGAVNFGGTLLTTSGGITFTNAITLSSAAVFDTSVGGGLIHVIGTLDGTVAGAQALTLASGSGNITLDSNLGSTRLAAMTITTVGNLSTQNIAANSLTQLAGTGTSTFNGSLTTTTVSGINLTGAAFIFGGAITTTTGSGPLLINNAGLVTFGSAATAVIGGALTQSGAGAVSLADTMTVTGAISFSGAVTIPVSQTANLSTSASQQNITFSSTVNGPGNLTLAAGSGVTGGDISILGAVGGSTRLGTLTISSAHHVSTLGIIAASITQTAGSGTTTLTGTLNTNTVTGISLNVTNLNTNGSIVTTASGPVSFVHSGTMTSVFGGSTSISGAFSQSGGAVSASGTLTTVNQPLTFGSAITLTGDLSLNSGTGGSNLLHLIGAVNGAHTLTLSSGTGGITLGAAIGGSTPLTSVVISSVNALSAQAISAGSLTQTASAVGGTSTFNGAISTTAAGGISLTGDNFHFTATSSVTTTNNGPCAIALTNSGALTIDVTSFSISGPFSQTGAGSVSLAADVITDTDNISFAAPVTLAGNVTLDTGVGVGDVTFSSTVGGTHALVITGGTGSVTFAGTIGATPLSSLTVGGQNITLANLGGASVGVNGSTNLTATAALTFTGTTYNANTQVYAGNTIVAQGGALTTFTTHANPITFTATSTTLSATTNLAINSALGTITLSDLHAAAGSLRTATINAGASGVIQVANVGTTGNGEFSSLSLTGGDLHLEGNITSNTVLFSTTAPHQIFLGGDITTSNTTLNFPVAVIRDNVVSATLTTAGGNIQFQSTLDGDGVLARNLTLAAGAGSITFTGAVGTTPLAALTITSAANVTAAGLSVGSLTQSSGTGTSTFNGVVTTTDVLGISLTGAAFTFNNTVTTTGGGGMTVSNTGLLNLPVAATLTIAGAFNQIGLTAPVHLADSISSMDSVLFQGIVTLTGNTSINTSATNKTITFLNTVDGAFDLSMDAGASSIICAADVGSLTRLDAFSVVNAQNVTLQGLTATSINLTNGTGTITFGNVNTDTGDITVTGNNFVSNGSITTTNGGNVTINNSGTITGTNPQPADIDGFFHQTGTGPYFQTGSITTHTGDILITSAMTIFGNAQFDTTGGGMTTGNDITFMSTVDGTAPFDLTAGTAGSISFSGDVGSITALGAITINSAMNVTTQAVIAASIAQTTGNGTTLFNGALSTSGAAGIVVSNTTITRGAAITTLNGGPLTITNNGGLFTSTAAGAILLQGAFTQNGTGAVQLAGSITTTSDNITFARPITLMGDVVLDTGVGTGNILISQTIQGAFNLTLDSDGGNTTLSGAVGTSMVPLTSVTITHANNVNAQAITAGAISQQTGAGLSTFSGALTATGASGITLTGTNFAINGTFTTQAASTGAFLLTNSGTATFGSGATGNIDTTFTQNGTGAVSLSNSITAGGVIQFQGAVSIPALNTATLNTAVANQNINFTNTITGPGNLTLLSGTMGDVTFFANATSLGTVTVTSVRNWTTQDVSATSILQSAGAGTTLFQGNLNTTASGGIVLTSNAITFSGNATTAALSTGPITLTTPVLTTTAGKALTSDGAFSQLGMGTVSLGGSVITNGASLSFTGAITLNSPVTLSMGAGAPNTAAINLVTVNGNQPFTLTAGGGDISVTGAIGMGTRVGAITVNSARNVTVQDMTAASITQLAGSGTSALVGNFDTNGPAGITMIGTNFTRTGAITTTNGGSLTVTNSGLLTGTMINTTSIDGSYIQNGTGPVNFAGTITTFNGPISFTSAITLLSTSVLDSSNASQNIILSNTVNGFAGTESLTLTAGGGDITVSSAVGGTTTIGPLTITSCDNITTAAVRATSIATSTPMGGIATFGGTLTTSAMSGIVLSGNQMNFNNVTTTGTGPMNITNTGSITFANGTSLNIAGNFQQLGAGAISYGAAMTTTNGTISFAAPITLTANGSLNTSTGGNTITLSGSLDGAHTMTVTAGGGSFTLTGTSGATTPLTAFTLVSANNATFQNNLTVAGPFATTAVGTTTFNGLLETTTGAISITGNIININNNVTTNAGAIAISNTGLLTIASLSPILSSSTFIQSGVGGTVSLGSNITTTGTLQIAGAITLIGDVSLNSGGGALTLSNTVNSDATPRDLTLAAGAGSISLNGAIGGMNPLDLIIFQSANNITSAAMASISAVAITQTAGSGLTRFQSTVTTSGAAGISLTGTQFEFDQAVTTTGNGGFSIVHTGSLTMPFTTHALTGNFSESGGGAVSLGATITTTSDTITFADPITLTHDATLDSTNGGMSAGANVHLINTVDGAFCLTLTAGVGDVNIDAALGAGMAGPLNCLSVTGSNIFQPSSVQTTTTVQETGIVHLGGNITTAGGAITITGNVSPTASITLTTSGGAGNIHITGTVNPLSVGFNLSLLTGAGTVTLDSTIGTPTPLNNLTITAGNISWNALGNAGQGATGTTTLTAATNIAFTGTTYHAATQIYTAGTNFNMNVANTTISTAGSPITFNTGTIQLNAGALSLLSNGGNISMGNLLGTGFNFTADAFTGAYTFTQIGAMGQDLNNVVLTASMFTPTPVLATNVFATSLTVNSPTSTTLTGPQTIPATYTQPVFINGTVTFSCGVNGDVIFNQAVNADVGGGVLAINFGACTGSVTFAGPVGGTAPLTSISIDQAINVTVASTMSVGTFSETAGTGTATFDAGLTTTDSGGISITSPAISLEGAFSTASGGPIALSHTGALTVTSGSSFNTDGMFSESGVGGTVSIGGVVLTQNAGVSFASATTLNGSLDITTANPTGGDISFTNTIDGTVAGAQNLTLAAGTGDITLSGAIGSGTRLGQIAIISAHDVNHSLMTSSVKSLDYIQLAGTGTTTLNGPVDLSGPTGLQFTGNNLSINNTMLTTSTNAPIVVTNQTPGIFTLGTLANLTPAGAFTQNGTGTNVLAGSITAGGAISFLGAATLQGATNLDSSTNDANITFSSTVNDTMLHTNALTLAAGAGNILVGAIGSMTPIGAFQVVSAENLTTSGIAAASITQTAGTGITTITGDLSTSLMAGISLTGVDFTIAGNLITELGSGGTVLISHTDLLALTAGSSTLIDGSFTESGVGGLVNLAGTVSSHTLTFNSPITLTGAAILNSNGGILTLDTVDHAFSLDLTAGAGNIVLNGDIGGSTALGNFTVHSVADVTYPLVNAASLTQVSSTGTTTLSGALTTTGSAGVSITGQTITQNGTILTAAPGPVTFDNALVLTIAANIDSGGPFSQTGAGAVHLSANIQPVNSSLSFAGPITLFAPAMSPILLKTGPVGNNITFGMSSTIDGSQDLTLVADGGVIAFNANVGNSARLGNLIIQSATDVNAQGIVKAASISQHAGSGTTTFNGIVDTNTASGITLVGNNFTFNANVTTTAAGSISINNSQLLTIAATSAISANNAFQQIGTGGSTSTLIAGTVTTTTGAIDFLGALKTSGTLASLDSSAANQPITFHNTVSGNTAIDTGNLTLNPGTGDITFQFNAGISPLFSLGAVSITNAHNLTMQAVRAVSLTQTAGTGTTLFNNDVATSGMSGISLTGSNISFLGNVTTTGGGPLSVTNTALLTISPNKTLTVAGNITQTGMGGLHSMLLAGTLVTTGAGSSISLSSPTILTGPVSFNTSAGNGSITFASTMTVDGFFPITMDSGSTGNIFVHGIVGGSVPIGAITIINNFDTTLTADITADSFTRLAGGGTSFVGTVMTAANLITTGPTGVNVTGTNFFRHGNLTTLNTGPVVITIAPTGTITGVAGNTTTIDGPFTQNGTGTVGLAGTITTNNAPISFAAKLVLGGNAILNSGAIGGNVTLSNTIDTVGGTQSLTVQAGVGNITLSQAVGANPLRMPLNNLTLTGHNITLTNIGAVSQGVTGTVTLTAGNTINFTGTTYNAHIQSYTTQANAQFLMSAGALTTFNSNGGALSFNTAPIQLGTSTNLTLNTTGGALSVGTVHAGSTSLRTLIMNSGAGTLQVGAIGTAGNTEFASTSISGSTVTLNSDIVSNALTLAPTGTLFANGDITTTNNPISFPTAVVLTATNVFTSSGGNITFNDLLDGDVADTRGLTLVAGSGTIDFNQAVGSMQPLSSLEIDSAGDVNANALTVDALLQLSGTGTTTLNGPTNVISVVGVQLGGTNFVLKDTFNTFMNGSLIIGNSGTLTLDATLAANLSGAFTQVGGSVDFAGTITAGQPVSIDGAVNLIGALPSIDTSVAGQSITFNGGITGTGALTLASGNGDVAFNATVGTVLNPIGILTVTNNHNLDFTQISANEIHLQNSTGTVTLDGAVFTNGVGGITVVGNNFITNAGTITTTNGGPFTITNSGFVTGTSLLTVTLDGFFLQNGTGPVLIGGTVQTNNQDITFTSAVTVAVSSILSTGPGAGNIIFISTLDGSNNLSLTAGTGDITFMASVGTNTRLGTLTIVSAADVNAGNIRAGALIQNGATVTGTTTLSGNIDMNASGGINLTGTNFIRGANWTTAGSGNIIVNNNNGGTFTSTAVGTINSAGSFSQGGTGPVSLSRTIITTNAPISFSGAVTLAGTTTLSTGAGAGSITFQNTLSGTQSLILNSGTANIIFQQTVGGTPLGAITVQLANNVLIQQNLTASGITQTAATPLGTTTFSGTTTLGAGGAVLSGSAFTVNGPITTSSAGPITISNSGQLTLSAACVADGAFTQTNGTGLSVIGANITSNTSTISFVGPASFSGTPSLLTTNQPMTFNAALNGPGGATLNPGNANISWLGTAGATTPLGALTFTTANNIDTLSISALSITQSAATVTGTTTMIGNLTTNGVGGIHLTGHIFNLTGSLISTNGGPCVISHSGLLTLNAGASTLLSGPFSESGTGAVSLSGLVHANDQMITFNNSITLTGSTTLNSDGGADITIVSAIDGAQDLVLDAGADGDILIQADIGASTPITTLTINNAHNVTTQAIFSGSISQLAGTGLTTFDALTTTLNAGIVLSGTQFEFTAPVNTGGTGPAHITLSGVGASLAIDMGAPFILGGGFSQLGTGTVSLCDDITASTGSILFTSPVTLCNTNPIVLDVGVALGDLTFLNTLSGAQSLTINGGFGSIHFNGTVSGLTLLQVNSALNLTAAALNVGVINISGVTDLTSFTSSITTTGALGITLSGNLFQFQGPITTTNLGPMNLDVSGSATFSSTQVISLDGPFNKTGNGDMMIGGSLTTNNQNVTIQEDVVLTGNFLIDTGLGAGNVTFLDDADGPFDLTIQAGTGDVVVNHILGDEVPLADFTVTNANNISLNGVGNIVPGVSGALTLNATNDINLGNVFYSGSQFYSAGGNINFISGSQVNMTSFGGPINFANGIVQLSAHSDLNIQTNNGAFSFTDIEGSLFENIIVDTGSGAAHLNKVNGGGTINDFFITAGSIDLAGTIVVVNTDLLSDSTIMNANNAAVINSTNTAFLNALGGDVGSLTSPINVNTTNQIFVGADGHANSLADINGSSFDNTVHAIPSNPPCTIIFNGIVIKDCILPPVPPPSAGGRRKIPPFPFAVPGVDSSFFNLASDYFFFFDFIDDSYFRRNQLVYARGNSKKTASRSRNQSLQRVPKKLPIELP
jgi:filamentous hemagglutinin family protein